MLAKTRLTLVLFLLCLIRLTPLAQDVDAYANIAKSRLPDGGFVLGNPEAGVKLIEFSDFLCGSCQNYEPIIAGFIRDYVMTGQAQFEYRIFPVIDPQLSVLSGSLVECADILQPGSFWRAHDAMFALVTQRGFTADSRAAFAESLDMDAEALKSCAATAQQHAVDGAYGMSLGVSGTPSLFAQYGDAEPVAISLALSEQYPAIVNALRPASSDPLTIEHGRYAGLTTFRRADGGFVLGDADAPLTIVVFEDFLCGHCQMYQDTLHLFIETYVASGSASFEYRFFPVVHPQLSNATAALAECVGWQDLGKFWDAHDLLFQFAAAGSLDNISGKLADLLDLDAEALDDCQERAMQYLIDIPLGQAIGISGTPAIRARVDNGALDVVSAGDQLLDRGGLPYDVLAALAEGIPEAQVGAPEISLLNDRFLDDDSLISGEPCAAPCWRDITPGETSLAEAMALVEAMDDLTIYSSGGGAFVFGRSDSAPCCQVAAQSGELVDSMLFQLAANIRVGELIEVHGEPGFVSGQPFSERQAVLLLYYPDAPMLVFAAVFAENDWQLSESSPVVTAVYATEELFAGAFADARFNVWKGYLSYREYLDG